MKKIMAKVDQMAKAEVTIPIEVTDQVETGAPVAVTTEMKMVTKRVAADPTTRTEVPANPSADPEEQDDQEESLAAANVGKSIAEAFEMGSDDKPTEAPQDVPTEQAPPSPIPVWVWILGMFHLSAYDS